MRRSRAGRRGERGAAVPEFVLVLLVLISLVFGIAQVALVAHVRTTMIAAASDGARAAAALDGSPDEAERRTRQVVSTTLADRFADRITVRETTVEGAPVIEVTLRAEVPPLGLWGPAMPVEATGHAVRQQWP